MCLLRPHELVCVDSTKETAHFIDVAWWFLLQNGRNSFLQRPFPVAVNIQTNWWSTYTWEFYNESIWFKARQDFVKLKLMFLSCIAKHTNVIMIYFHDVNSAYNLFQNLLNIIRVTFETVWTEMPAPLFCLPNFFLDRWCLHLLWKCRNHKKHFKQN